MTARFILIEEDENGARAGDLFDDEAEAIVARDDANRDAEQHSIPPVFRLFRLTEVDG